MVNRGRIPPTKRRRLEGAPSPSSVVSSATLHRDASGPACDRVEKHYDPNIKALGIVSKNDYNPNVKALGIVSNCRIIKNIAAGPIDNMLKEYARQAALKVGHPVEKSIFDASKLVFFDVQDTLLTGAAAQVKNPRLPYPGQVRMDASWASEDLYRSRHALARLAPVSTYTRAPGGTSSGTFHLKRHHPPQEEG
ncbi:hypothetical protein BGZ68_004381 [Mortierella alpina]|nr:hypothetical protein BGZ68_004381 [Mortierella alpina]